ncbi:MAG: hypothetical protein JST32_16400 [Bacteroidetes bacterium]|nr:hypothetical protein [Bacteroidota bacterium]
MVIFGISIGTRTSGIAVLSKKGLLEWQTLSFKNSWSEEKADFIVRSYERYIKRNKVTVISIKIPPASHVNAAMLMLMEKLVQMLTYHGCMVEYKTKQQLKELIPEIHNTKQLINYATALYPVLAKNADKESANRNKYYHKMFEAVVVAHQSLYRENYPPE